MNKKLKKSVSAALICTMILTTATTALNVSSFADNTTSVSTTAGKSYTIKKKTVDLYYETPEDKRKADICFVNGTDIPYMEINDLVGFIKELSYNPKFNITIKAKGDKVTLVRENKYSCVINFADDTLYFADYNAFLKSDEEANLVDNVTLPERDENGRRTYLKRVSAGTNERYGNSITMDLGSYGIDLVRKGDKYYMPLQTFRDTLVDYMSPLFLFNGKAVFVTTPDMDGMIDPTYKKTALGKLFYNGKTKGSISKELAEFNYNELCFALDKSYGLKDNHNIRTFDELMTNTGLKKMMLTGNSTYIDTAMYILSTRYLDDCHTKYGVPGYATDYKFKEKMMTKNGEGAAKTDLLEVKKLHEDARAGYYPDGVPGYEEIGDTAFITFDVFNYSYSDFYANAPTNDPSDTIGLISYSVQQILRKDSPVKNVVLDLSCNTGGAVDAAVYTIGAFLGKARLSIEDRYTGAVVTSEYHVDTNLDHKFDSKDYLAGKGLNLYCLESGTSFSCGNLVPCMFKQSSLVTLLGETSGGGAGSIMWLGSAAGGTIRISSATNANFLKNGSLYDVDRGADPDIYLSKLDSYYDREGLVEFIHGLK